MNDGTELKIKYDPDTWVQLPDSDSSTDRVRARWVSETLRAYENRSGRLTREQRGWARDVFEALGQVRSGGPAGSIWVHAPNYRAPMATVSVQFISSDEAAAFTPRAWVLPDSEVYVAEATTVPFTAPHHHGEGISSRFTTGAPQDPDENAAWFFPTRGGFVRVLLRRVSTADFPFVVQAVEDFIDGINADV